MVRYLECDEEILTSVCSGLKSFTYFSTCDSNTGVIYASTFLNISISRVTYQMTADMAFLVAI